MGKGLEGVGWVPCSLVLSRSVITRVQRLSVTARMVKTLVAAQREFEHNFYAAAGLPACRNRRRTKPPRSPRFARLARRLPGLLTARRPHVLWQRGLDWEPLGQKFCPLLQDVHFPPFAWLLVLDADRADVVNTMLSSSHRTYRTAWSDPTGGRIIDPRVPR